VFDIKELFQHAMRVQTMVDFARVVLWELAQAICGS
jgi:hypothetical protein